MADKEKYLTPEEHAKLQAEKKPTATIPSKPIVGLVVVIALMGISFYGGTSYQKSHSSKTSTTATTTNGTDLSTNGGAFGRRGTGARPTFGTVTAVSSTSITVNDTRTSTSKMLSITSSTVVTNNGASAAVNDIAVGDTVAVTTSTTDTSQATRILLNPSFGGSGGGQPPTTAPTDTNLN